VEPQLLTWSPRRPGPAPTCCSGTPWNAPAKVAVTKVALRQRESLAALRSHDGVLVLETMLWPDEVRVPDFSFLDQDIEVRTPGTADGDLTHRLDDRGLRAGPIPRRVPGALEELVAAKAEGREVTQPAEPAAPAEPASLLDALQASLDVATRTAGRPRPSAGRAGRPARKPRSAQTPNQNPKPNFSATKTIPVR